MALTVRPDDEVYQFDTVWLGPDEYTLPIQARYVAWGTWLACFLLAAAVLVPISGSGAGGVLGSLMWALALSVVAARAVMLVVDHERPLRSLPQLFNAEARAVLAATQQSERPILVRPAQVRVRDLPEKVHRIRQRRAAHRERVRSGRRRRGSSAAAAPPGRTGLTRHGAASLDVVRPATHLDQPGPAELAAAPLPDRQWALPEPRPAAGHGALATGYALATEYAPGEQSRAAEVTASIVAGEHPATAGPGPGEPGGPATSRLPVDLAGDSPDVPTEPPGPPAEAGQLRTEESALPIEARIMLPMRKVR